MDKTGKTSLFDSVILKAYASIKSICTAAQSAFTLRRKKPQITPVTPKIQDKDLLRFVAVLPGSGMHTAKWQKKEKDEEVAPPRQDPDIPKPIVLFPGPATEWLKEEEGVSAEKDEDLLGRASVPAIPTEWQEEEENEAVAPPRQDHITPKPITLGVMDFDAITLDWQQGEGPFRLKAQFTQAENAKIADCIKIVNDSADKSKVIKALTDIVSIYENLTENILSYVAINNPHDNVALNETVSKLEQLREEVADYTRKAIQIAHDPGKTYSEASQCHKYFRHYSLGFARICDYAAANYEITDPEKAIQEQKGLLKLAFNALDDIIKVAYEDEAVLGSVSFPMFEHWQSDPKFLVEARAECPPVL